MGQSGSHVDDMVNSSNCKLFFIETRIHDTNSLTTKPLYSFCRRNPTTLQTIYETRQGQFWSIDKDEFVSIPQIANNPLGSRLIAIFDEDGGGNVNFHEFIKGLSAFSARGNKREKLEFAFKVYDMDRDGFISNGELFLVLKMMVGNNLKDNQLQQIVDKTIMEADKDMDGKISFDEFLIMVENTDVANKMTLESF
ncbi:unnamed protein product [Absidia cylindrospora]